MMSDLTGLRRNEGGRLNGLACRPGERLPPHSPEAEQGVLGCILLDPAKRVHEAQEWLAGEPEAFYELRHREIYQAMIGLVADGSIIDVVTVMNRLKGAQKLEAVGGMAYLSSLPDVVPSAENLGHYLSILWEKFLARKYASSQIEIVSRLYERDAITDGLWGQIHRDHEPFITLSQRHSGVMPREIAEPNQFEKEYSDEWMGKRHEHTGWKLPFELADFVWRPYELTILAGDSETGKSTWLSEACVCAAKQGAKVFWASMEEPVRRGLHRFSRQILGANPKPPNQDPATKEWKPQRDALAFLQQHFRLYNFLGITQWQNLLDCFHYAQAKLGCNFFVCDNLGLIGIGDEDLEAQAAAAAQFNTFAHTRPVHVVLVTHTNKGEGSFKQKVRGNKRWTDLLDNLLEFSRNEKKREAWAELAEKHRAGEVTGEKYDAEAATLNAKWDAKIALRKQKWGEGERRNAARYLYFDWLSKQFRDKRETALLNYLA